MPIDLPPNRSIDDYRCRSLSPIGSFRCQQVVGHRYNHAAQLSSTTYRRWADDGTEHIETDTKPGWVRSEGQLRWSPSFPRVEDAPARLDGERNSSDSRQDVYTLGFELVWADQAGVA